tara:strand:+ start:6515 stop:6772 length:258 start_codon:yes stop_codon:yes gene_type:complete
MCKIKYKDLVQLGFERENLSDTVHYEIYGTESFVMTLKLTKKIYLTWDCEDREVFLIRGNKEGDILGKHPVVNTLDIANWIRFFK